jgi:hypothetical protein
MRTGILVLFLIVGFTACRSKGPYNPYLHSKHKPSEEIKSDYIKTDRWFRKKRNIQKIYFDKK